MNYVSFQAALLYTSSKGEQLMALLPMSMVLLTGFPRLLESPGTFFVEFPEPGKSWKMILVPESPGNLSQRSWKAAGMRTRI